MIAKQAVSSPCLSSTPVYWEVRAFHGEHVAFSGVSCARLFVDGSTSQHLCGVDFLSASVLFL